MCLASRTLSKRGEDLQALFPSILQGPEARPLSQKLLCSAAGLGWTPVPSLNCICISFVPLKHLDTLQAELGGVWP